MGPKEFTPPKTEEEKLARYKEVNPSIATTMIKALKARRAAMVKSVDEEIDFYEGAINWHKEQKEKS